MLASHRLKALGARRVNDVVEFYGNTAQTMRNIYARNPRAFDAMVLGYLQVLEQDSDATHRARALLIR
ncbi:hypothetical protein [Vibrio mediterranei]|uniref:hypothetical protein n=1 Tax=Vibrio mediterranei TaxID=689 RepID=UPI001EFC6F2B|nr:hypothetical protein [Vibrio mediterranei]MCG9659578.1 hypothetical protein [Vibrio mediterranei]